MLSNHVQSVRLSLHGCWHSVRGVTLLMRPKVLRLRDAEDAVVLSTGIETYVSAPAFHAPHFGEASRGWPPNGRQASGCASRGPWQICYEGCVPLLNEDLNESIDLNMSKNVPLQILLCGPVVALW